MSTFNDLIPSGWIFVEANFTKVAAGVSSTGSVSFRKEEPMLPNQVFPSHSYIDGNGATLDEAILDAFYKIETEESKKGTK